MDKYRFNSSECGHRCDGISKMDYQFTSDLELSEHYERLLIKIFNEKYDVIAGKRKKEKYPDIEICNSVGETICFLEVEFQLRTFMKVAKYLSNSGLVPSETLALNESDLVRYFNIASQEPYPIYIVLGMSDRPCVTSGNQLKFFYQ